MLSSNMPSLQLVNMGGHLDSITTFFYYGVNRVLLFFYLGGSYES
jgi:hypothetical protein